MDVLRAVVAQRAQVGVLEDVERLQHRRALLPDGEFVDVVAAVVGAVRLLDQHFPVREVGLGEQAAVLLHPAHDLIGDIALVEAVVRRVDGLLARLLRAQRLSLGLDQLAERRSEVGLPEDLARDRRLACLAHMREEHTRRVLPLLDARLAVLDPVRRLRLDRIALLGHLDRRREHLRERHRAVLGEHRHQATRCAGRHCRERAELRRKAHALGPVELRRRPARGHAKCVDADDLLEPRMVDERLRLTTAAERIPHGARGGEHRRRRVHRVAALLEDHRAGGRGERLAGHRHPVLAVEDRSLGLLCTEWGSEKGGTDEEADGRSGDGPDRYADAHGTAG